MSQLLKLFLFSLLFAFLSTATSCTDSGEQFSTTDNSATKRVHPPEALKLADSAFHAYYMRDDSCSFQTALDLYNQSLKIDPDNFITLSNTYQIETRLGLHKEALNTTRRMLKLSNYQDVTCISMVGGALERCGDSAEAMKFYRWSLEITENVLDTMSVDNRLWISYQMNKATVYLWMNEYA